jgi:hypothetical protein
MKIYNAAVYTNNYCPGQKAFNDLNEREQLITSTLPNILESYHYIKKGRYVDEIKKNNGQIFLDSGAFSAFNIGSEINIDEYCDFVKQNIDILRIEDSEIMASVLDGIGDPLKTWNNQAYMEKKGVKPLPCFHYGEDTKYLDWYIKYYPYITIGGMVGKSKQQLIMWLDRIWNNNLLDKNGRTKVKVHAFGITSIDIMKRYPWYSCDSSSWVQAASFGTIITPDFGPISISDKSPARHDKGRHVSTLTDLEKEFFNAELNKNGFNYERLSTIYQSRVAYNLWSFGKVNEQINESTMTHSIIQELF